MERGELYTLEEYLNTSHVKVKPNDYVDCFDFNVKFKYISC